MKQQIKTEWGKQALEARLKLALSIAEVAEKTKLSIPTIRGIERGEKNFSFDVGFDLAKFLNIELPKIKNS